jgi:small-conductance mechanosensitive channel
MLWRRSLVVCFALALLAVNMFCGQVLAQGNQTASSPGIAAQPPGSPTAGTRENGAASATSKNSAGKAVTGPESSPVASNGVIPEPTATAVDGPTVISYLGRLITWYRHLQVEERLATEPAEALIVEEDRQNANRVLDLGFQYADAAAKLLNLVAPALPTATTNTAGNSSGVPSGTLKELLQRKNDAQAAAATAKANVQRLKETLRRARSGERNVISHQLATAQAELELAQSQIGALGALVNFENGGGAATDLQTQIDQLKASVSASRGSPGTAQPVSAATAAGSPVAPGSSSTAPGMVGQAEGLIALTQKLQELDDTIELTNRLTGTAQQLRIPLHDEIQHINQRMLALGAGTASSNLATVKDTQNQVTKLAAEHKLVIAALLPLSMQTMVLTQYVANLERWRAEVKQRSRTELRDLLLNVGGLVLLLISIVGGAALWRRITFRYIHDIQRRHQVIQLSRIIVVAIVALVLLFYFANELGALATVMGFAAAGIALTLQNVILSLAGYFYISGRYGIRVGDRVQITGINGDVIEIGLFKMTVMELDSGDTGHEPTGRVTVFPNSVVFQPNGNFSKQLPGSDFAWNELRLTLAPECDYRLAERRLVGIVSDVFSRYRDLLEREYRGLERNLNHPIEQPRPQSRLRLSEAGIELVIRYPVRFQHASETADEIARRLVDALKREPALRLVTPGTPLIQPVEAPAAEEEGVDLKPSGDAMQHADASATIDNRAAAGAAAAAGATIADAFIDTSRAAEKQEGVDAHDEAGSKR